MRSALLVVDVQNGVVAQVSDADAVVATVAGLVRSAREHHAAVVWVQHDDEELTRGSLEWQIVPALAPRPDERRVEKRHRSAFAATGLADALRSDGVTRLVLVGTQSAFCVDMAGKAALTEGFDVTLVSDGHADGDLVTAAGVVAGGVVRATVNRTWSTLRHPGRQVEVCPAAEVTW